MAEDAGSIWPAIDKLLGNAEKQQQIREDVRAQTKLVHALAHPSGGYWQLPADRKQSVILRLSKVVPRIDFAANKRDEAESLFALYYSSPKPYEDIGRALKYTGAPPRVLVGDEPLYAGVGGWIGSMMHWAQGAEVPMGYFFWAAVAALGAACRYDWYIDRQVDYLRMNYYLFLIGKAATGKSISMLAAKELVNIANRMLKPWAPGDPLPDFKEATPFAVRLLPDATIQALCNRMAYQDQVPYYDHDRKALVETDVPSTGLLLIDELGTFLGREAWQVSQKLPVLAALYSSDEYDYETVRGGLLQLRKVALSIIGCSTPKWLRDALSPLLFTGGFMDRVLTIHREPISVRIPTPEPRDPVTAAELARFLVPLMKRRRPEEITADKGARHWYDHWYHTYPEPTDDMSPTLKRRALLLWKLAAALAISNDSGPYIRTEHFETAAAIIEHEDSHFQEFLKQITGPPEMDHMNFIERKLWLAGAYGDGVMLQSELYQHLKHRQGLSPPTQRATPYLLSLVSEGRLELVEVKPTRGRPGKGYRLSDLAAQELDAKFKRTPSD